MGLDYTKGCVNFRDVGECLNLVAGRELMPVRRLLRGGKLEFVESADRIGTPGTIVNLRSGPDPPDRRFGADHFHFPAANDLENYDTARPLVRAWLNGVIGCLATDVARLPVLVHCTSGKDRTGVVVASALAAIGVERELIVGEYLFSDGDVSRGRIEGALDGIGDPAAYFRRVDVRALRKKLLSSVTG